MQQKYFKRAVDVYEKLLQETRHPLCVWNNLGLAYKGCGRIKDARDAFSTVFYQDSASRRAIDMWIIGSSIGFCC